MKLPLQVIVRAKPGCFRIATVCPAPLWDTLRIVACEPFDWPTVVTARAWADGRLLDGVWTLCDDGFARRPLAELNPAVGLARAWVRPCGRQPGPVQLPQAVGGMAGSA